MGEKAPGTIVPERNRIKRSSGKLIFPIEFCAVLSGCFAAGTFSFHFYPQKNFNFTRNIFWIILFKVYKLLEEIMNKNHIGFIGFGLIGGSIAKALKENNSGYKITAFDINIDSLKLALKEGIVDVATNAIDEHFSDCDFIFMCAPVLNNASSLEALKKVLNPSTILTDVGSVKTDIHKKVKELSLENQFIGGHPMAGSERIGYANSNAKILENAYYILTPTDVISTDKIEAYTDLITQMHAIPLQLTFEEHDFVTAAISHLPHVISASLVNLVKDSDSDKGTMKAIAAGGFKDITRISSSSPVMWQNICLTNKENILKLLEKYMISLEEIKDRIAASDEQEIYDFFDTARNYRDSFIEANSGPIKKAYTLHMELADRTGALAEVVALLAKENISIKNIGILHNREYQSGAMHIEVYDNASLEKAKELLIKNEYTIYAK